MGKRHRGIGLYSLSLILPQTEVVLMAELKELCIAGKCKRKQWEAFLLFSLLHEQYQFVLDRSFQHSLKIFKIHEMWFSNKIIIFFKKSVICELQYLAILKWNCSNQHVTNIIQAYCSELLFWLIRLYQMLPISNFHNLNKQIYHILIGTCHNDARNKEILLSHTVRGV